MYYIVLEHTDVSNMPRDEGRGGGGRPAQTRSRRSEFLVYYIFHVFVVQNSSFWQLDVIVTHLINQLSSRISIGTYGDLPTERITCCAKEGFFARAPVYTASLYTPYSAARFMLAIQSAFHGCFLVNSFHRSIIIFNRECSNTL